MPPCTQHLTSRGFKLGQAASQLVQIAIGVHEALLKLAALIVGARLVDQGRSYSWTVPCM